MTPKGVGPGGHPYTLKDSGGHGRIRDRREDPHLVSAVGATERVDFEHSLEEIGLSWRFGASVSRRPSANDGAQVFKALRRREDALLPPVGAGFGKGVRAIDVRRRIIGRGDCHAEIERLIGVTVRSDGLTHLAHIVR